MCIGAHEQVSNEWDDFFVFFTDRCSAFGNTHFFSLNVFISFFPTDIIVFQILTGWLVFAKRQTLTLSGGLRRLCLGWRYHCCWLRSKSILLSNLKSMCTYLILLSCFTSLILYYYICSSSAFIVFILLHLSCCLLPCEALRKRCSES